MEDGDPPTFRQTAGRAPEKIMFQFFRARLFETVFMPERTTMKINSMEIRVRPGERDKLGGRSTTLKPFFKSKKRYHKLLEEHVEELSELQPALRV